jgi:hypothetical protein
MRSFDQHEKKRLTEVAEEYRKRGYTVYEQPMSSELPGNLRGFRPDLMAVTEHDFVVVEVRTRANLSDEPRLAALAEAVNRMPGWRFELVAATDRDEQRIGTSYAIPEILKRLALARKLAGEGEVEVAFIAAWAATEAMMREAAYQAEISLPTVMPTVVMNSLVTQGILSRDSYQKLLAAMRVRSSLAHGFAPSEDPRSHLDNLLQVVNELQNYPRTDA